VKRILPVLSLVCLLPTGCSLHTPGTIELPSPPPAGYREAAAEPVPAPFPGRWWRQFEEPRLNALMATAFADNLDLARTRARLDQATAALGVSRAGQWPTLTLQGESRRESSPGFFGRDTGTSHRLSLAAGFELDLWRKLASRTEATRLDFAASREEVKTLYLTLSAQIADLYFLAVEQRAQLALADRNIAAFADTLQRVRRRYREGLVPALDVYQARQSLAAAQARRPDFVNRLAQTEHALAVLVGRYPGERVAGKVSVLPAIPEQFPAGLPSQLLTRRPDVRAALLRLKASDARIAAAIADRFPSFNLLGNYGHQDTAFSTGDIVGSFWNIALDLAQPLLDGGRRRAEVERSRAVFRENLANYRQSVLTAFQEVEDALVANRTDERRIARLEERVAASEAALRLALDRYLQGLSDYLPVLTAQGAQFDAQSQLLAARRQLVADRITLARVLGGQWMDQELQKKTQDNL